MKASIYLNNDKMQLAWHDGKELQKACIELPEGTVLNGVPIRQDVIVEQLVQWRTQYKISATSLVVDSNHITMKKMTLPTIPRKQLLPIIKNEFEIENKDGYIFDYSILEKGKKESTLIACATPIEFVEKYLKCFDAAKIRVKVIDIALTSMIKYVMETEEFASENLLINVIFGNTLFTVLFKEGEYIFSNRNRLMNQDEPEEYITEIYEKLSGMLQFANSQKTDFEIQKCLYIGLDDTILSEFKEYVAQFHPVLGVVDNLDRRCPSDCFYAATQLTNKLVDINLKRVRKSTLQKMQAYIKPALIALAVIIMITPVIVWAVSQNQLVARMEEQIAICDMYLMDEDLVAEANAIEEIELDTQKIQRSIAEYDLALAELSEHRILTVASLRDIFGDQLPIKTVQYSTAMQKMEVVGGAASREDADAFVGDIRSYDHFDFLHYTHHITVEPVPQIVWTMVASWAEDVIVVEEEVVEETVEEGEADE